VIEPLEDQAARYILRQEESDWSQADQDELDDWLQSSARHKAVYWRLRYGWTAADRIAALDLSPANESKFLQVFQDSIFKVGVVLAASIIPLIFLGSFLLADKPAPQYTQFFTQLGQRKMLSFPDGSHIDLNTNSVIRVRLSERNRIVYLDRGEAYFEVAPDKHRPFYVFTGDRLVRVLGTKFAIRKEGGKVATAVVEGRVQLGRIVDGTMQDALILKKGDSAISMGRQTLAVYDKMDRVSNAIGWVRGLLTFDRMSLVDAASEFNRYNERKLVIEGEELGSIKIGGAFRTDNVEAFAHLMSEAYDLKVEESEDQIKITKN
jgi:transmembrane sensor